MPKKKFSITIENDESINHINVSAILKEDEIIYKETDGTLTNFNYKHNILTRENKDLKMKYRFLENTTSEGTIEVKELQKEINVMIETGNIIRNKNNIEIEFKIEDNNFIYRIEEIV